MCGAPSSLKQQPQLMSAYLLGILFCFLLRKGSLKNLEIQNVLITPIILLMTLRRCTHLPDKEVEPRRGWRHTTVPLVHWLSKLTV